MTDFKFTDKNPRFFYDTGQFLFLKPLVDNFSVIKEELLNLLAADKENQWMRTFPSYVKSDSYKAWKIFSFIFFYMKFPSHAKLCPKTAELVYSIPEILSCDYSFMKPHTHIMPHKGYTRMALRCHLPLIVDNPELCKLRVGNEIVHWKEGELIIFDDSFDHEAWNNSDRNRVVLMFDIPNPLWGYSSYEISKYKIEHIDDPFLLAITSKEKWQESFEKKLFPLETFSE
ncbi:MAG TPA: aspartyl/asparaginyl beta-hydroxylase domain-containing protein [Bacteroidia bacterium]|nr:aspartyl/asparaginyl beta-hydroxylase domain-containing protein [Bacteroidia bacterium]